MTTRGQLKRAVRIERSDASRGLATEPLPSLPERLYTARERKGVDLYRAERDTKIRARYLGALERGDYKELPGAVYTKGFLRNYALYLGLDPDEVLLQWRNERGNPKEAPPAIVVPRPIATPRKGMSFSPGLVVAALLAIVVIAFGVYLGIQVLRFAKPPTVTVTQPATAVIDVDESTTTYTLKGTTLPGATVSILSPGHDEPFQVTATSDGTWAYDVDLRRGRNQFDVSALDPETGKRSEGAVKLFLTVPFLQIEAPTLTVDQPSEGASFENGAVPVGGKATNASSVSVAASYLGPSGSAAAGGATATPPTAPATSLVTVGEDGAYSTPLQLAPGRWAVTVSAAGADGKATSITRNVAVVHRGVDLVVTAKNGRAWIKVWVDGKIDSSTGAAGKVLGEGRSLTFRAHDRIEVRTGSSGATAFTLNGTSLGTLGKAGAGETWLFAPPAPPARTQRR
ncbi:MAG: helix-turn-helix domain-containing protein [Chloroflexota bacterium]